MNNDNVVLSVAYLPPVEYLLVFLHAEPPYIEVKENFIKQSYRNRCIIPTANGLLNLSIPVIKNGLHNCPIDQVRLDYSQPWQRTHWRALEAAYNASPFFLYYRDYLEPFFIQQEIKTLLEFNWKLFDTLLRLFGITKSYSFVSEFVADYGNSAFDVRNEIHPKKMMRDSYPYRNISPYRQVFSDRIGFFPNMSCVDLLFNEGKMAKEYLVMNNLNSI